MTRPRLLQAIIRLRLCCRVKPKKRQKQNLAIATYLVTDLCQCDLSDLGNNGTSRWCEYLARASANCGAFFEVISKKLGLYKELNKNRIKQGRIKIYKHRPVHTA